MKRVFLSVAIVLTAAVSSISRVYAAGPAADQSPRSIENTQNFEGEYSGYLYGDHNSKAKIKLDLTHRGDEISGHVDLDKGLYVDGGVCGSAYIPAVSEDFEGITNPKNENQLSTQLVFTVDKIKVVVDLVGELSDDGQTINTEAKIDLPWICGRDPVIRGEIYRIESN